MVAYQLYQKESAQKNELTEEKLRMMCFELMPQRTNASFVHSFMLQN